MFITHALINNSNVYCSKLWGLTFAPANLCVVVVICALIMQKRWAFLFMLWLGHSNVSSLLPLSNTLFTLHPLILIWGSAQAARLSANQKQSVWPSLAALSLAIFLGGFWSLQELNWGGWWNWDVLELGSLVLWLLFVSFAHQKCARRRLLTNCATIGASALTCYSLNKSGIGTSIHSFVSSVTLKHNFLLIVASLFTLSFACRARLYLVLIAWLIVYMSFVATGALKLILLVSFFVYARPSRWQYAPHTVALALFMFTALFNRVNIIFTWSAQPYTRQCFLYYNPRFVYNNGEHVYLWSGGWRSKPRSTRGALFYSLSNRSPQGAVRCFSYKK